MHDFRADNLSVLCESLSIGRSPAKWLEIQRINRTFLRNRVQLADGGVKAMKVGASSEPYL